MVLPTSEYVEGKTKRRNRLIDPKLSHDKTVLLSVMQIAELTKSLIPFRMDTSACAAVDGTALHFVEKKRGRNGLQFAGGIDGGAHVHRKCIDPVLFT